MSIPFQFNAQSVKPADPDYSGGGWPVGEFPNVIVAHEVKPTASGDGGMVEFTLQGIDQSPVAGTTFKFRLNLFNKSAKAVEIAQAQLSAICHCVGYFQFNTTEDFVNLYNKPFNSKIDRQKDNQKFTEWKGAKPYAPFNPATLEASDAATQHQATQPATGGAWGGGQQAPQQQQTGNAPATGGGWSNTAPAHAAAPAQATQQAAQTGNAWGGAPAAQPAQQQGNQAGQWQQGGAAPAGAPKWAGG